MNRTLSTMVAAATIVASVGLANAAEYVDGKPLVQVVTVGVRDCRGGEGANVPMITWGGDIITLHANGDSLTTQPGSPMADEGLNVTLKREDKFQNQVEAYLRCDTPYLRGTVGQLNLAADLTEAQDSTKMVIVYQHSWSNGGDALVVSKDIKKPADLAGKTIALQKNGPHVAYVLKLLKDAGVDISTVTFKWTMDLTGLDSEATPEMAMLDGEVDAAMVIIPDAARLTSGGAVGTGAEGSVKGAKILLSTKSASRIIADVYAVRKDYFDANKAEVQSFVRALHVAEDRLRKLVRAKATEKDAYKTMIVSAATHLLDAPAAIGDAEGLYADAETVGVSSNQKFFTDTGYPRNFAKLVSEIQASLSAVGLTTTSAALSVAPWDYSILAMGLDATGASKPRFDSAKLQSAMTAKAASGGLDEGTLFSFQINFRPNQAQFAPEAYADAFNKVVELAATYPGAVITIEGHSDVLGFLKARSKKDANGNRINGSAVLNKIRQAARNLSVGRANSVRDTIIAMASSNGFTMDTSQFVTIGHGISQPLTGLRPDGVTPNAPKTKPQWLSNMRVKFNIVNIEGESESFELLSD